MNTKLAIGLLFLGLGTSGCALTSKGDALAIRWYTPEAAKAQLTSASTGGPVADNAAQIELGRVYSGLNLREKIAYRDSAFEEGFYEDKRWTERPEVYVRRELEHALYEEHGLRRALAAQAPALEVEVMAFEEVIGPNQNHAARVVLKAVVHDEQQALLEKTYTVERPVDPNAKTFAGVVQAMSLSLDAATDQIVADTQAVIVQAQQKK